MEIKVVYAGSDSFWDTYHKGRPRAPDSFFKRVFDYHAQRGGAFNTVHDAGAGGGVHSARLAEAFEKVIVSDVSQVNLETAKSRLHDPKYEFNLSSIEGTIDFPPASVDMVFASSMLHFCDIPKAIEAVIHQLKPRGTFAVPCIGLPRFIDAPIHQSFRKIFHAGINQAYAEMGEPLLSVAALNASAYDCVALPETYFQPESQRIRLNEDLVDAPPGDGTYYDLLIPENLRQRCPPLSEISRTERIVFERDDEWCFRGDATFVKTLLQTFPFDLETEEMKHLWTDLAGVIGEGEVEGRWVVYLILATRK